MAGGGVAVVAVVALTTLVATALGIDGRNGKTLGGSKVLPALARAAEQTRSWFSSEDGDPEDAPRSTAAGGTG